MECPPRKQQFALIEEGGQRHVIKCLAGSHTTTIAIQKLYHILESLLLSLSLSLSFSLFECKNALWTLSRAQQAV